MFNWTQKLTGKWAYGSHEEQFDDCDCNSREEAIEHAKADYGEDYEQFWIGKVYELEYQLDAESLLENMADSVYGNLGEYYGEDITDVAKQKDTVQELYAGLNAIFQPWCKKYLTGVLIDDIEEVKNPLWKEGANP